MRVSIASALADGLNLLLLDKPFAALDEMTRFQRGEDLLAPRLEAGLTVLFVTHSVFEAASFADAVAVMTPWPERVAATVNNSAQRPRRAAYRSSEALLCAVGRCRWL